MGRPNEPWKGKTHDETLRHLADDVIEYCEWYCEHGMYLPKDYEKDPAGWSQVLRYIQATFEFIKENRNPSEAEIEDYKRGLKLFYKHFKDLFHG